MAGNSKLLKNGFLQALGLVVYCGLVSLIFWRGDEWFGKMSNYWGPVLLLMLLVLSALVCGIIVGGYPLVLWKKKRLEEAVRVVVYTAGWLAIFVLLFMGVVIRNKTMGG